MRNNWKGFVLGVITTCLLMGTTVAYAASSTKIDVYFEKLKYIFEGVEKSPSAEQGQGFIYNGTTYVPLRFVTESLGKEVGWNGDTKTITIGKQPIAPPSSTDNGSSSTISGATGTLNLTDLPGMTKEDEASMLNVDKWGQGHNTALHAPTFQIAGTTYSKGLGLYHHNSPYPPNIKAGGTVQYPLNGKYTKFTAIVGADDSAISNTAIGTIKFIGDGKELLVVDSIAAGKAGIPVELDVSGVQNLRINFNSNRKGLLNQIVADPKVTLAETAAPASTVTAQSDLIIVERDKKAEYVVLKNRGSKAIDLKDWRVLSVNGQQSYTFQQSFSLDPDSYVMLLSGNEAISFAKTGVDTSGFRTYSRSLIWTTLDIWNNEETDAAELYNPAGTKVSEYIN